MASFLAVSATGLRISLSQFVLLYGLLTLIALVSWWQWQVRRRERAAQWQETEATIQSAGIETVRQTRGGGVNLPVCAFTYVVGSEYYSGRFSLAPASKPTEYPTDTLVNRKLPVRYDPDHPENWYIPLDRFDNCVLEQKMRPHLIRLYPKD